jgi:WD40 repeat protein
MVFSPDGETLAAGYDLPGNIIKLWDMTSWKETATIANPGAATDYHDIIFSPNGKLMAYAVRDGIELKVVDLATMEIILQTGDFARFPYEIAFSPDGSLLASAGDDFKIRLWDMNAGKFIKTMHNGHEVGTVAFSPDGTLIAFSVWDEGVQIWRITY